MSIESVTQAVSNLALEFGDDDARKGAMVSKKIVFFWYPLSHCNKSGHYVILLASTKFIEFLLEVEARGIFRPKSKE